MIENEVWLINQILLFLNILIFGIFFVAKFKSKKPQILIFLLLGMASTIQLLEISNISNFQYSSIITLLCNVIWTRIMYKDIEFINFWQSSGKE